MRKFRPTAKPLVTVDPYFSIWAFGDNLYDDVTRHWTGRRNAMTCLVKVDGTYYRIMGRVCSDNYRYYAETENIYQTGVKVDATQTMYAFENDTMQLELKFRTPLLMDDLYLMSRPVSYISAEIRFKDEKEHTVSIYFDISSECCVDNLSDEVTFGTDEYSIFCGKGSKDILKEAGDDKMIEWGTLHLIYPGAKYKAYTQKDKIEEMKTGNKCDGIRGSRRVNDDFPVISAEKDYGKVCGGMSDFLCVAYDDIYAIEFFGERLEPFWKGNGDTFNDIVKKALEQYPQINEKCDLFDQELRTEAMALNPQYADIICLVYRHVIAAHKLCQKDGRLLFFSKECFSNGCIATVDITYPSIPMFLLYNPDLVEGMLNPIFEYVTGEHEWNYEFAPHDLGIYPKANGQFYGTDKEINRKCGVPDDISKQMPVEESGNMILCCAALCKVKNNADYVKNKLDILGMWADYLVKKGYDPADQLCTDDFAGVLAHNCNLSLKAILAIAAFGYILDMLGRDGRKYSEIAKDYADRWQKNAFDGDHYKLTFDRENTWSLKYNLVWDKFFGFGLFPESVAKTEVDYYKTKINEFGIPLDCRRYWTKSDWQMWTASLTHDAEYFNMITVAMWRNICDMKQRVPFSDYYETKEAKQVNFQARSVQGGLFMPIMMNKIIG